MEEDSTQLNHLIRPTIADNQHPKTPMDSSAYAGFFDGFRGNAIIATVGLLLVIFALGIAVGMQIGYSKGIASVSPKSASASSK